MDKGDLFTLVGGFVVLLLVAVIVRPDSLLLLSPAPQHPVTTVPITVNETPAISPEITPPLTQVPVVTHTPSEPSPPYRIMYTSNPFTYPKIHLPDNMVSFGASDIPLKDNRSVTFAYMEGTGGGLTQVFTVPYEIWALNMTVTANRMPQYAMFKMVVCDAKTGAILQGGEIQFPGSMYKIVRASGPVYMIITTSNVDSFRIDLETPYRFYTAAAPAE
ncbi:hypothetical protein [Methanoregula sp. UBA64]|uniref:hypothetical protein n=1 Tax=Methanoregula sp. UBA64 TaxID=1915554 RepID=UPI0025E410C9|nr:hypothetical protein [Methanoregula sp. UBA64]